MLKIEIDLCRALGVDAVEDTDVADAVEWDAHGDLELGGRQVDARNHLGRGMLHLQTRVEFQKVERVVLVVVQVLDRADRCVADEVGKPYCGLFSDFIIRMFKIVHTCSSWRHFSSEQTVTGASSIIFWWRRWTEQSRPKMEIAWPY